MIEHQLPVLLVVIPMLAAPLCVLLHNRRLAYALTLAVCWTCFGISVFLLNSVLGLETGKIHYDLGGWAPPYGIEYVVDYLSAFVMLFVSGFGALAITFAPRSIDVEIPKSKHYLFFATYMLCLTGLLGICITGDLFNVFVFLEISSLSSYAMISLGKSRRSPLAAFQYLIMGSIGATFILIGIGLLYQMTGTLNMADIADRVDTVSGPRTVLVAFAFMTIGLCIKMAVFPLHTWLPNAYTHAPSVVTVFIAATSTKVSVYAVIRLIYQIYSPEFAFESVPMGQAIIGLSLIGIFVASIAAIFQDDIKRLLAYSSVAQIGYMLLGIGMGTEAGLAAGIVHMFNHALIKGGLFMVVACFMLRLGSAKLEDLRGVGRTMPWTSLAWVLGGLGLIGVPVTCGFISKWMLLNAAIDSEHWPMAVLMLLSSLLAVVYVWKVVETLYFSETISKKAEAAREAPLSMLIPTYLVIAATIVFGVWTEYSASLAQLAAMTLTGGGQ